MSRRHRQERRPAEAADEDEGPPVLAVALIRDQGGHRLVTMRLPASLALKHAETLTEPELLVVQVDAAARALLEEQTG